jgi:hypothetical protein
VTGIDNPVKLPNAKDPAVRIPVKAGASAISVPAIGKKLFENNVDCHNCA